MNTGLPKSHKEIMKIHREALGYALLEAFLESVPQFTLQCSIIMRTGNTSKFLIVCQVFPCFIGKLDASHVEI